MNNFNFVAYGTDSYKQSHWRLLPDDTTAVYSYGEPRTGGQFGENVFFGLQYIIMEYLAGDNVVTLEKIKEARRDCEAHFGSDEVFNYDGWVAMFNKYNGRLPLKIKSLPEGMVVPNGTCLFTVESTDSEFVWLPQVVETMMMHVWSATTVASSSREIKKIIARFLDKTGDPAGLEFKLHDFGFRGVSSLETAMTAGAAHLVNFMGSDTMAAIPLLRNYYGAIEMPCFSIPATEHSIMTSRGPEGEADVVRQVLREYPTGLVAMVGDSYDMIGFIKNVIGGNPDIMEAIVNREGTVVFRPDSGTLPKIDVDVFCALEEVFGSSKNEKGYAVLPDYVRMIQGDGIKWNEVRCVSGPGYVHTVEVILDTFEREGISVDNIAFGSGGGLLQCFNRDTQRFAIKCSAMRANGNWRDIFKRPATDPTKNSKRGRLKVVRNPNQIVTCREEENLGFEDLMVTKFFNGEMQNLDTLEEIRQRAAIRE